MGVLNVTPDSGDGRGGRCHRGRRPGAADGRRGADLLDVGGESGRDTGRCGRRDRPSRAGDPGRRAALPALPSASIPRSPRSRRPPSTPGRTSSTTSGAATTTPSRARRGLAVPPSDAQPPRPLREPRGRVADLQRAIERALAASVAWDNLIVDPSFLRKTPGHNLALLRTSALRVSRPLLGTSRKSTLGKILDLPPEERLEATLATTALGIASGVDVVRVHDVRANVRVARVADAVVRGGHPLETEDG
jgi:dihydropteroate synthase